MPNDSAMRRIYEGNRLEALGCQAILFSSQSEPRSCSIEGVGLFSGPYRPYFHALESNPVQVCEVKSNTEKVIYEPS